MKTLIATLLVVVLAVTTAFAEIRGGGGSSRTSAQRPSAKATPLGAFRVNRYDPDSLSNPYGAGSRYKTDGLLNPYSPYGSPHSNQSWRNPYATEAPKLYTSCGQECPVVE